MSLRELTQNDVEKFDDAMFFYRTREAWKIRWIKRENDAIRERAIKKAWKLRPAGNSC